MCAERDYDSIRLMPPTAAAAVSAVSAMSAEVVENREGPFGTVARSMEKVVRDGIARGEFRPTDDVQLTTWLLSGIMRAGVERMMRDQVSPTDVSGPVQDLIIGAERRNSTRECRPGRAELHAARSQRSGDSPG